MYLQALISGSEDATNNDVISSIATYLTALKSNVVSTVNRNRRMWRERAQAKSVEDILPESRTDSVLRSEALSHSGEEPSVEQEEGVAGVCGSDDQKEVTLHLSKEEYDKCMLANELLSSFVTALTKTEQSSLCETT